MSQRKRLRWLSFVGVLIVVVTVAGYYVVTGPVRDSVLSLIYRLREIEAVLRSYGRLLAVETERYQAARGDARLLVSEHSLRKSVGTWRQLPIPWRAGYFEKTKALAAKDGMLYAGLLGPRDGDAAVWRYDGERWESIGNAETVSEWSGLHYVQTLLTIEDDLYAGIDNEVWRFHDDVWTRQLADDAAGFPWGGKAYALRMYRGRLYAGINGTRPRVFRFEEDGWQEISDGLPRHDFQGIYELWAHSDGALYVGLAASRGSGRVYRLDQTGGVERWRLVGGNGVNGSWISEGFHIALSFASHGGRLIVSLNRNPMVQGRFSSVWSFDGTNWRPVGAQTVPPAWGIMSNFNALLSYEGRLYVGGGGIRQGMLAFGNTRIPDGNDWPETARRNRGARRSRIP